VAKVFGPATGVPRIVELACGGGGGGIGPLALESWLPHFAQNFAESSFGAPQLGQYMLGRQWRFRDALPFRFPISQCGNPNVEEWIPQALFDRDTIFSGRWHPCRRALVWMTPLASPSTRWQGCRRSNAQVTQLR